MKVIHISFTLLLLSMSSLLALSGQRVLAQSEISLDANDIQRLGIVFMPVRETDTRNGTGLPATVINSPQSKSSIRGIYSGVLNQWHVLPGESVAMNDLLATIESNEILEIQNQWIRAKVNAEQLSFEVDKDRQLLEQGIISALRLNQTERNYQQASFTVQVVREQLLRAGFNDAQVQGLADSALSLGRYYVRAIRDGQLSHQAVMPGAYIDVNTELGSIKSEELWISSLLPARIGSELSVGQSLSVAGVNAKLELMQKDQEIDTQTQTIEILARFLEKVNLLPGQIISLIVPAIEGGVLIPADAVVHSGNETTVFIRTESGVESRVLMLDPVGSDYQARMGVAVGEFVVIRGSAILKGIQLGLGGE